MRLYHSTDVDSANDIMANAFNRSHHRPGFSWFAESMRWALVGRDRCTHVVIVNMPADVAEPYRDIGNPAFFEVPFDLGNACRPFDVEVRLGPA